VLGCACSRKYYNVVASKIGFGRSFTIISKDLSVGGKYELVFAIHCVYFSSVGKSYQIYRRLHILLVPYNSIGSL
jgi:hypothetical protein